MIYFITGNVDKFKEAKAILPDLELLNLDLPEIQELDPHKIIEAKIQAAFGHNSGEFVVEDGSLTSESLGGLPGPFAKWFLKALGVKGLYEIFRKLGDNEVEVKVIVGYARNNVDIHYFEGAIKGKIVSPRGENGFGWDPVFQPHGFDKTFAEMTSGEKNSVSMRKIAFTKLKEFLEK